jgi:uncharacterized membrane protein YfhO
LWQPLVALVITSDLLLFAHRLYPAADPALLEHTPEIITRMQADNSLWRLTTLDPRGDKIFPANAGWMYSIQDIRGYDSVFPAGYRQFMETLDSQDELLYNRIAPLRNPAALDSPLLDLLNVRYLLTGQAVVNPRYHLVARSEELLLYRNSGTMPRAFSLPYSSTIMTEDPFGAMRNFDPRYYMILPKDMHTGSKPPPAPPATPTAGHPRPAAIDRYRNNEVILSVTAAEGVWLILADSYDRGWQAEARPAGSQGPVVCVPVQPAYGALRAVLLQPGDWVVRFRYRPAGLAAGLVLSLAAVGLTGIGLLAFLRGQRYPRSKSVLSRR